MKPKCNHNFVKWKPQNPSHTVWEYICTKCTKTKGRHLSTIQKIELWTIVACILIIIMFLTMFDNWGWIDMWNIGTWVGGQ